MCNFKRFFAAAAVALFTMVSICGAVAQPGGGQGGPGGGQREQLSPEKQAEQRTETLTKELDLTDEQAAEVKAIYLEYATAAEKERAEMRTSGQRPNREEMMAKQKQTNDKMTIKIKESLTEPQSVKFDTYLEKQAEEQAKRAQQQQQRGR